VGSRAGLDAVEKTNIPSHCQKSNPDQGIQQAVVEKIIQDFSREA